MALSYSPAANGKLLVERFMLSPEHPGEVQDNGTLKREQHTLSPEARRGALESSSKASANTQQREPLLSTEFIWLKCCESTSAFFCESLPKAVGGLAMTGLCIVIASVGQNVTE